MDIDEKNQADEFNDENGDQLSGEEILNKIDKDASEPGHDEMKEGKEEGRGQGLRPGLSIVDGCGLPAGWRHGRLGAGADVPAPPRKHRLPPAQGPSDG